MRVGGRGALRQVRKWYCCARGVVHSGRRGRRPSCRIGQRQNNWGATQWQGPRPVPQSPLSQLAPPKRDSLWSGDAKNWNWKLTGWVGHGICSCDFITWEGIKKRASLPVPLASASVAPPLSALPVHRRPSPLATVAHPFSSQLACARRPVAAWLGWGEGATQGGGLQHGPSAGATLGEPLASAPPSLGPMRAAPAEARLGKIGCHKQITTSRPRPSPATPHRAAVRFESYPRVPFSDHCLNYMRDAQQEVMGMNGIERT